MKKRERSNPGVCFLKSLYVKINPVLALSHKSQNGKAMKLGGANKEKRKNCCMHKEADPNFHFAMYVKSLSFSNKQVLLFFCFEMCISRLYGKYILVCKLFCPKYVG